MSNYRLIDVGFPYKKIMHGRKWVGRVIHHADGTYRGYINKVELSTANTETDAFREAVSKHLGFSNSAALHEANAITRQRNLAAKRKAQYAFNEIMNGNFKPLDELFGFKS